MKGGSAHVLSLVPHLFHSVEVEEPDPKHPAPYQYYMYSFEVGFFDTNIV